MKEQRTKCFFHDIFVEFWDTSKHGSYVKFIFFLFT